MRTSISSASRTTADLSAFIKLIETDLYGGVHMSRAAVAALRRSKGSIVDVSSVLGVGSDWNHGFYCAAKGAVTNFARALAMDEAKAGVRVDAVNPSLTYTPFTAGMKEQPDLVAKFEERIPMGRGAEPDDISGEIAFLASEDAPYITGINPPVDGGLSASNGQARPVLTAARGGGGARPSTTTSASAPTASPGSAESSRTPAETLRA